MTLDADVRLKVRTDTGLTPKANSSLSHFLDILYRTGTQSVTDRRLLCTPCTAKGPLERLIRPDTGIDLEEARSTGQDVDETIEQLPVT